MFLVSCLHQRNTQERTSSSLHDIREILASWPLQPLLAAVSTAVTISGIAISQSVATAGTLDKLLREFASALSSQNNINSLVQLGTLNLNQRTSLMSISQITCLNWLIKLLRLVKSGFLPFRETPS